MTSVRLIPWFVLSAACMWFLPARASAYTWMIRHGYTNCATCHVDPSGGGVLSAYGRAQGALIMATRWDDGSDEEGVARWGRLAGAVDLPAEVQLGADFRGMGLFAFANGKLADQRFVLMQSDVQAAVAFGRFRASASAGLATDGALAATVFGGDEARLVSRSHWAGVSLGANDEVLVRAGRMNLPFGVRILEHTAWVRSATRTDGNASQEHGVSVAYNGETVRGEAMIIAGNFQLGPDAYRERGYSAYVEWPATERLAVGASSLVTHAALDTNTRSPMWRHAHGAFVRYSPNEKLVLLGEADMTLESRPVHNAYGIVAFAQSDYEPLQGLHLIATFELRNSDLGVTHSSFGGWASVAWFFLPHMDVRVDGIVQSLGTAAASVTTGTLLMQLHAYL